MRKSFLFAGCTVVLLGLSACDNAEDEARITELEGELETMRGESETLRTQYEESQARIAELEGAGLDTEALQEPMATAMAELAEVNDQLQQLEEALAAEGFESVSLDPLRTNVEEATQSLTQVAEAVGLEAEATEAQ